MGGVQRAAPAGADATPRRRRNIPSDGGATPTGANSQVVLAITPSSGVAPELRVETYIQARNKYVRAISAAGGRVTLASPGVPPRCSARMRVLTVPLLATKGTTR